MKAARFVTIAAALALAGVALAGGARPRPTAARIVRVPSQTDAWGQRAGNVSVKFSAGYRETWTTKGHCLFPKVSKSGLVGWTYATTQHSRGGWMNNHLRLARGGRIIAEFHTDHAFIDFWDFADYDTCVVIRGVNAHGPTWIQKYRIDNGELVAEGSGSGPVEEWARPYSDDVQPGP